MHKTIVKPSDEEVLEFLRESNAIEGVFDDDSLKQAKHAWDYIIDEPKLTPGVVLKTHKILMLNQPLQPNERGYFRKSEVMIGGRLGKPFYAVPELIDSWAKRANEVKNWNEIMMSHVEYEHIHPFIDGNGRTGRIFLNWQRIHKGMSLLVIRNDEKEDYYRWF